MQYDPHNSDDEMRDVDLSDEMLLLGEQLSDDAAFLAAQYPAGQPHLWTAAPESQAVAGTTIAHWSRIAAVLLVSLGVGSGVIGVLHWRAAVEPPVAGLPAGAPQPMAPFMGSQFAGSQFSGTTPTPLLFKSDGAGTEAAVVPVVFFQSLSGPEQEALIDLMESDGLAETSVSF
jgi:hypothetical protein